MEFEKRKAATLAAMSSTEVDKSPKGTLDTPIIPLLKTLNLNPSFFTTSSCSGRISVLSQPPPTTTTTNPKKKARGGTWLFITHDPADADSVIDLLFRSQTQESDLVFRFEPFILAVECKDVSSAQSLVSTAISCGFRESGITNVNKRVIIAIRCSIRLEVPLGEAGRIMVSPEYVRYLVGVANEKMEANRRRTEGFFQALQCGLLSNEVLYHGEIPETEKKNLTGNEEEEGVCSAENEENIRSTESIVVDFDSESTDADTHLGLLRDSECNISIVQMAITGEPVEKLFLWGHSACTLRNTSGTKVLVFGGFGGLGRHARRNDSLMLDPSCGILKTISVNGPPSPRLGHTSVAVGEYIYVIGGRGGPVEILNDVWVLNTTKNEWRLLECSGSTFHPRHRHAAAVVGSKMYVFGGLNNEFCLSSMHVLDTEKSQWNEITMQGEWPCARHSHSLVANGSTLFMFGGHDGEKALGDLYSFSVNTCAWKKEKTSGENPYGRFSHSMFVYKNYLGIFGGCPVRQHNQEVALLDMRLRLWKHVTLNSIGKHLFVRSTASVIGDDLVMIGGGASCYAFGTKFNEPVKMCLLPLVSFKDVLFSSDIGENCVDQQPEQIIENNGSEFLAPLDKAMQAFTESLSLNNEDEVPDVNLEHQMVAKHWVIQLERKHAKLGKDILKKYGWLDLTRKVYSRENGLCICLPVTENFSIAFHEKELSSMDTFDCLGGVDSLTPFPSEGFLLNEVSSSSSSALNILLACGCSMLTDEVVSLKKFPRSPQKVMSEAVGTLIRHKGFDLHLLEQLPTRWERLGDIIVLPVTSFKDPIWDSIGKELWSTVAKSLNAHRLARQGRVASTGTRDSTLEILVGDDGWVGHRENGILYSFDATKCMFSWGNLSEKVRMARLDCRNEVIVDLFAGIGYFVLPFLVKANAKLVYACEWNPHAVEALRYNVQANSVADRCVILEGDNRLTAPKGVADRVCLGLLPASECSWCTAVRALRIEGGILHVHGNVKESEEGSWLEHVAKSIGDIVKSEGFCWEVSVQHLERVKWYGPHIRHLVADIRCKEIRS